MIQSQEEMIKQLKEENLKLRQSVGTVTPGRSKPVAVTDPLTMKETADQLKDAKQNVPKLKKLPRSNHIDFIKKIEKVLELKKGMKKFLQDVHDSTTAEVEIVKTENKAKLAKVKLTQEGAISDDEANVFCVFLAGKIEDGAMIHY